MANTLLTLTMITREALRILHNNLVFAKGVNRQYSEEFAVTGAKIGTTINVRKPNKYPIRVGQTIQIAGTAENFIPLTLTTQAGVDTSFSSQDLTLSLDDFGKRILSPAMARVSSKVDFDGLGQVAQVYNAVGTPGTTPGSNSANTGMAATTAPIIFLNAGVLMDNGATPRDENRRIILNPIAQANSVANLSGLFNDQGVLGTQYRKGVLGNSLGFEFAMDQNINLQNTGTRANGTANGANQTGSNFSVTAIGNAATVLPGEIFTVANVFAVNPENLQSTGLLQQFVVLPSANANGSYTADANGNATFSISPPITPATGSPTNPLATVTASPANGANLTWAGTANTLNTYVNNIAYHQDAFTLATADLIMPGGVDFAARETYDGVSMRIVRAYDITNDLFPTRIDILYGWATLRPEMAARIWG